MASVPGGYQPNTRQPASRRADFDLLRRIARLEILGGPDASGNPNEVTIGGLAPTDSSELWVSSANILYAKVGDEWVPISGGGDTGGGPVVPAGASWVMTPAETGPRGDSVTQARFGNVNEASKRAGFFADADSGNLVIAGYTKAFTVWDQSADGTSYRNHASFKYGDSSVYPWRLTTLPHGGACLTRWELTGTTDYTLLSAANDTLLNAPSGGALHFRIGNSGYASLTPSTFSIYGPTLSCYAINSTSIASTSLSTGPISCGNINAGTGTLSNGAIYCTSLSTQNGAASTGSLSVNGYIWNNHWIQCHKASQGGSWEEWGFLAKGAGLSTIGFHNGVYATGIRSHQGAGEAMECINYNQSGFSPIGALRFDQLSTITQKREVRSLRPERERIVVHLDPAADRVSQPDVMALRPVAFRYKVPLTTVDGEPADGVLGAESRRERLGLIAEEVQHVIPSAVTHDADGTVKGVDYSQVTVALLDHVQRLTDEIATLRYRVTELEGAQP